ncbi:putative non-specific serine/threonine protein kinase [Helianthus anomalus]
MNTCGTLSSGTFVVPHSSPSPYKDDVYSFGILLLELVSGRERPYVETESLGYDVCDGEINIIDEFLIGRGFDEKKYVTLRIAENCVQTHQDGERSMLEVYKSIRAIGMSRDEIPEDSCIDLECNEGDV